MNIIKRNIKFIILVLICITCSILTTIIYNKVFNKNEQVINKEMRLADANDPAFHLHYDVIKPDDTPDYELKGLALERVIDNDRSPIKNFYTPITISKSLIQI